MSTTAAFASAQAEAALPVVFSLASLEVPNLEVEKRTEQPVVKT